MNSVDEKFTPLAALGYTILFFFLSQLIAAPVLVLPIFVAMGYDFAMLLTDPNFLLTSTLAGQILGIVLLLILFRNKKVNAGDYLNFRAMTGKLIGVMLLAFLVATGLVEGIGALLEIEPNSMMMDLISRGNIVIVFFTLTIFAPLAEEFFFRGFLFKALEARYSPLATILATSLIFTASHAFQYDLSEVSLVFLLALVMGFLRYRWQNIYLPLGVHFLNNFVSFLAFLYFYDNPAGQLGI